MFATPVILAIALTLAPNALAYTFTSNATDSFVAAIELLNSVEPAKNELAETLFSTSEASGPTWSYHQVKLVTVGLNFSAISDSIKVQDKYMHREVSFAMKDFVYQVDRFTEPGMILKNCTINVQGSMSVSIKFTFQMINNSCHHSTKGSGMDFTGRVTMRGEPADLGEIDISQHFRKSFVQYLGEQMRGMLSEIDAMTGCHPHAGWHRTLLVLGF